MLNASLSEIMPGDFTGTAHEFDQLRERASEQAGEDADNAVIYYHQALEIISEYSRYEPDVSEVRDMVSGEDAGDWRKVMTVCAYLTARAVFEEAYSEAIESLQGAVEWAEGEGFEVTGASDSCDLGWLPHATETDTDGGNLLYWSDVEGSGTAWRLHLIEDGIWLKLTKEDDEE